MGATTLTSKKQNRPISLNTMVGAAIVLWAGTFASVYGPFVFGYIAMHAATTGVFLLAVHRSDRRHSRAVVQPVRSTVPAAAVKQPLAERRSRPQPVA
jgi:low temperature requirement protein LtrA